MEKQFHNTLYGLQKIQLFFILPTAVAVLGSGIFLCKSPSQSNTMEFLNYCMILLSLLLPFSAYGKLKKSSIPSFTKTLFYAIVAAMTGVLMAMTVVWLEIPAKSGSIEMAYSILLLNTAFVIYLLRFFFINKQFGVSEKKR